MKQLIIEAESPTSGLMYQNYGDHHHYDTITANQGLIIPLNCTSISSISLKHFNLGSPSSSPLGSISSLNHPVPGSINSVSDSDAGLIKSVSLSDQGLIKQNNHSDDSSIGLVNDCDANLIGHFDHSESSLINSSNSLIISANHYVPHSDSNLISSVNCCNSIFADSVNDSATRVVSPVKHSDDRLISSINHCDVSLVNSPNYSTLSSIRPVNSSDAWSVNDSKPGLITPVDHSNASLVNCSTTLVNSIDHSDSSLTNSFNLSDANLIKSIGHKSNVVKLPDYCSIASFSYLAGPVGYPAYTTIKGRDESPVSVIAHSVISHPSSSCPSMDHPLRSPQNQLQEERDVKYTGLVERASHDMLEEKMKSSSDDSLLDVSEQSESLKRERKKKSILHNNTQTSRYLVTEGSASPTTEYAYRSFQGTSSPDVNEPSSFNRVQTGNPSSPTSLSVLKVSTGKDFLEGSNHGLRASPVPSKWNDAEKWLCFTNDVFSAGLLNDKLCADKQTNSSSTHSSNVHHSPSCHSTASRRNAERRLLEDHNDSGEVLHDSSVSVSVSSPPIQIKAMKNGASSRENTQFKNVVDINGIDSACIPSPNTKNVELGTSYSEIQVLIDQNLKHTTDDYNGAGNCKDDLVSHRQSFKQYQILQKLRRKSAELKREFIAPNYIGANDARARRKPGDQISVHDKPTDPLVLDDRAREKLVDSMVRKYDATEFCVETPRHGRRAAMKDAGTEVSPSTSWRDTGTQVSTPLATSSRTSNCASPTRIYSPDKLSSPPARHNTPARLSVSSNCPLLSRNEGSGPPVLNLLELEARHLAKLGLRDYSSIPPVAHRHQCYQHFGNVGTSGTGDVSTHWSPSKLADNLEEDGCHRREIGRNNNDSDDRNRADFDSTSIFQRFSSLEARAAAAWEEAEKAKLVAKHKREEAKIDAWINLQKAKADAELKKLEVKLEKIRSQTTKKVMQKVSVARRRAEEMRAAAELQQTEQMKKIIERASHLRRTAHFSTGLAVCFARKMTMN